MSMRVALEVGIVILQTVIVIFLLDIRTALADHEVRIDALAQFASAGDRWTLIDQRLHESDVSDDLQAIRAELSAIRVELERIR